MRVKFFLCLTASLYLGFSAVAQSPSELIKKQLEGRYKGQQVNVVPAGVIVVLADLKGLVISPSDFGVHYDHFFEGAEVPKKYQERDHFDERTTQDVDATAAVYASKMDPGETLDVVRVNYLKAGKQYQLDFMLRAIASTHLSVRSREAQGATILAKNAVGVHFRFYIPADMVEQGRYDAIVQEIDRYFLPKSEYAELQKKAATAASAPKVVELGQTPQQVESVLGKPETIINLGSKTTFVYKNMKVIFVDGKVEDVQ